MRLQAGSFPEGACCDGLSLITPSSDPSAPLFKGKSPFCAERSQIGLLPLIREVRLVLGRRRCSQEVLLERNEQLFVFSEFRTDVPHLGELAGARRRARAADGGRVSCPLRQRWLFVLSTCSPRKGLCGKL